MKHLRKKENVFENCHNGFYSLPFYPFAKMATAFCCFHYNGTRQCYDKIEAL